MFGQKTMIKTAPNALYISYDGILDPVGESQVIPYLKGLAKKGVKVFLISFEKKERSHKSSLKFQTDLLLRHGIDWRPLLYHQNPAIPATLFDIFRGFLRGRRLIKKEGIQLIHARGYISAMIAQMLKIFTGAKFIFDMRGFWPEEKVDAGAWRKNGFLYWFIKRLEVEIIKSSDEVIVLTEVAKEIIGQGRYSNIAVIPCCVDLDKFSPIPEENAIFVLPPDRLIISYLGSLGTFYNFAEAINFFRFFKERFTNAYFLVITNNKKEAASKLEDGFKIKEQDYSIFSVPNHQVPQLLSRSDLSLIFYRRKLSAACCCPIKFAESLACGVPVIISPGIGDCNQILIDEKVGAILKGYSQNSYVQAINEIENLMLKKKELTQRCRNTAKKYFSLESGVEKYFDIYRRIK